MAESTETPTTAPAPAKKRAAKKTAVSSSSSGSGKVTLTTFWTDFEGWAGTAGKQYAPGASVSLSEPEHVMRLRQAGYVAGE